MGFGRYTVGGRAGKVYDVTTLADNSRPGSLRYALSQSGPRIVRFKVSGIIMLESPLEIEHGHLTVEGQTSPVGVVIAGAPVVISADQVILRYLRFRLGTFGYPADALGAVGTRDVIVDHCSISWSVDEAASFYNNTNFTLQNSIVSSSLDDSIHPEGAHGHGGIWGGRNASFIGNIVANHRSRTPRINGHRMEPSYPVEDEFVEVVNNVIFNWGDNNVYGCEDGSLDLVNNFYLAGGDSRAERILELYAPISGRSRIYVSGNVYRDRSDWTDDNLAAVDERVGNRKARKVSRSNPRFVSSPRGDTASQSSTAELVFKRILSERSAGANKNQQGSFLDSVDAHVYRQIEATLEGESISGLIDHESEQIKSWDDYGREFEENS
jgi:hypothetical protein